MYPERKTRPLPLVNRDKLENAICTLEGLGIFWAPQGLRITGTSISIFWPVPMSRKSCGRASGSSITS